MNDPSGFDHSLTNFRLAVRSLREFLAEPVRTDRDRSGVIQAFEFCFELSWKTLQKYSASQGINVNGPRPNFREAVKFGFLSLDDEARWILMLEDRNLTSHTYKKELAVEVVGRIERTHLESFEGLLVSLEAAGDR